MSFKLARHSDLTSLKQRKLPREGALIAALDMGAAKTVCFIARLMPINDGSVDCDIIGAGHFGAHAQKSAFENRTDADPHHTQDSVSFQAREKAVRNAIEAAETMAGERISEIHVAVPGAKIHCRHIGVDLDIAGGFVTGDDIADSLHEGARLITPEGARCLHVMPTGFSVDSENLGTDPRGMRGQSLTTRMLGVYSSESHLANTAAIIESAGLRPASFVAGPLMMARSVVVDDEKELGVLVINIGAQSIEYAVYSDGRPTGCGGVKVGAANITRDIAQCFSTPIAHAERQKILHGTILSSSGDEHRFVDFIPLTNDEQANRVSRADLTSVILARMEEIYEIALGRIIADQCAIQHLRRVVITGGGSQLDGLREHAERVFSMKSRLGRPLNIDGAPEALSGPSFSTCAGTLDYVARSYHLRPEFPETQNVGGVLAVGDRSAGGGVAAWLRAKF